MVRWEIQSRDLSVWRVFEMAGGRMPASPPIEVLRRVDAEVEKGILPPAAYDAAQGKAMLYLTARLTLLGESRIWEIPIHLSTNPWSGWDVPSHPWDSERAMGVAFLEALAGNIEGAFEILDVERDLFHPWEGVFCWVTGPTLFIGSERVGQDRFVFEVSPKGIFLWDSFFPNANGDRMMQPIASIKEALKRIRAKIRTNP